MAIISDPISGTPYALIMPEKPGESMLSIDESTVKDKYKQHGAILFRGFDFDIDIFGSLTKKFCASAAFNRSEDREVLNEKSRIQTVNLGVKEFPLHPELSREPWKPDVCFFASLKDRAEGGETVICDGVEIVRRMSPEIHQALESRRLLYQQPMRRDEMQLWLNTDDPSDEELQNPPAHCPFSFNVSSNKAIIRQFSRPALHTPMFTDELAFGNFLFFAWFGLGVRNFPTFEDGSTVPVSLLEQIKAIADEITCPIAWQRNDLVMIDNTRFMHGRRKVVHPESRLIATYFGYLNFAIPGEEEPRNAIWRHPGANMRFT
jgi:alpha-ketoglutarate-dependent taurine dioxygenase